MSLPANIQLAISRFWRVAQDYGAWHKGRPITDQHYCDKRRSDKVFRCQDTGQDVEWTSDGQVWQPEKGGCCVLLLLDLDQYGLDIETSWRLVATFDA